MDNIICVIVTLLNDLAVFFINGCDRWLFLEVNFLFIWVMAAGCWSELRGGCFWEV